MQEDQQARLDFLEVAVPALIAQRNEAHDQIVKVRAEAALQIRHLEKLVAALEGRVKSLQAGNVEKVATE